MPTCGGLRIGVLRSEPKTPPLVIVNVPPVEILQGERSVRRPLRVVADRQLDFRERHPVGIAKHRHDQPAFRPHRDADVVVALEDDLVALDLGVELRKRAQRDHADLDEERRDAETDAVLLLERLFVPLAETHDGRHVDLVERRQHRRVVLRLDQPARDGRAALGHSLADFFPAAPGRRAARGRRRRGALRAAGARFGSGRCAALVLLSRRRRRVFEPGGAELGVVILRAPRAGVATAAARMRATGAAAGAWTAASGAGAAGAGDAARPALPQRPTRPPLPAPRRSSRPRLPCA